MLRPVEKYHEEQDLFVLVYLGQTDKTVWSSAGQSSANQSGQLIKKNTVGRDFVKWSNNFPELENDKSPGI